MYAGIKKRSVRGLSKCRETWGKMPDSYDQWRISENVGAPKGQWLLCGSVPEVCIVEPGSLKGLTLRLWHFTTDDGQDTKGNIDVVSIAKNCGKARRFFAKVYWWNNTQYSIVVFGKLGRSDLSIPRRVRGCERVIVDNPSPTVVMIYECKWWMISRK